MKKSVLGVMTLVSAFAISLAACGNAASKTSNKTKVDTSKLAIKYDNPQSAIKGGSLKYALVSATPFAGVLNAELYDKGEDAEVMQFGLEGLFKIDENYKIIDGGAANLKLDVNKKTATITINSKVKWSDGQPLTSQDIVYAYKMVANKDTETSRYTESLQNIVGLGDYHTGKATEISGITTPNDLTAVIHFKNMKPGMVQSGNGYYLESAEPAHYLSDIPFKSLLSSDKIRVSPLFFGPFKVDKIIAGQSIRWVPNTYYWQGLPKLSSITIETVPPSSVVASIKSHKYDVIKVPSSKYTNITGIKGIHLLGHPALSYSYIGFKVGKWNDKKGENIQNSNAKMGDKALRNAIGYAMNIDQVNTEFYNGLQIRAKTLIPPVFEDFFDSNINGHNLNMKKANQLLDDAGYKMGKDGYRTDKNGKKLTINFAAMQGGETQEPVIQNYIQQWKKAGLRVKLVTGRLIESNSFYDKVQNDDPSIDMYEGVWGVSSEPSPTNLYSAKAPYNMSRMNTAENTKLLDDIDSLKSFDLDYRINAFKKWQEYMNKEAYVLPEQISTEVTAVRNRVKGYDLTTGVYQANYHLLEVTSDK